MITFSPMNNTYQNLNSLLLTVYLTIMPTDQVHRKSGSPQASTEVSSLQLNRTKNKEALEKSLKCRRSVKELVNQGILLNPSISHPDKVRQLQKAKTSDLLKRKIGQRPDRQYLISHHILRGNFSPVIICDFRR
ncbi:unnamed protein product [Schistosoma mattheei]|uniref:Uncharacterized protein n=1 Tax=Schistosoma mattheei TaxID=31246 RepID=A0AA85AUJ5_9TREM|nr:unnamed protein product [Schistosoma mattheei]